jgi:alkylhydroperoxidase family enzyme
MEISELTKVLVTLGCPAEKSAEMAAQLDKRARQLAAQKGCSYEEALQHLLALMKQGWAAQGESSSVERRASRENGQI